MRRWLPLLLAGLLALGCAGCEKRQTVTVYRIETGGTALLDPVQVALDALGAKPSDSTCTNPVCDWLTIDGSRMDDDGTLWLTVTATEAASGITRTQALACLVLTCTALDGVTAVGLAEADGDVLHAPTTADELALTDPATDTP